ncbi:hypothetical protein GOODEAATRI_028507 [Goodea atripinnis]|uniref:Uncharacterized protein n=1 Tax=Goodea atripinnis TaxID=208336 RepID=A0ABV0MLG3_9TELE
MKHRDAATVLPTTHVAGDSHLKTTSSPFTHLPTNWTVSPFKKKIIIHLLYCRSVNLLMLSYVLLSFSFYVFKIAVNLFNKVELDVICHLSWRIIRPEITLTQRRNVFKNIQNNQPQGGFVPLT